MKWQDVAGKPLSSSDVCRSVLRQLKPSELLAHHEHEPLVLWAWSPGRRPDGTMRTLPPLTHAQFVKATAQWIQAGTPCP